MHNKLYRNPFPTFINLINKGYKHTMWVLCTNEVSTLLPLYMILRLRHYIYIITMEVIQENCL